MFSCVPATSFLSLKEEHRLIVTEKVLKTYEDKERYKFTGPEDTNKQTNKQRTPWPQSASEL
jgi:hypothetical protein